MEINCYYELKKNPKKANSYSICKTFGTYEGIEKIRKIKSIQISRVRQLGSNFLRKASFVIKINKVSFATIYKPLSIKNHYAYGFIPKSKDLIIVNSKKIKNIEIYILKNQKKYFDLIFQLFIKNDFENKILRIKAQLNSDIY
jgi:hypothetical protein